MRRRTTYIFLIFCTLVLSVIAAIGMWAQEQNTPTLSFLVTTQEAEIPVYPYKAEDGTVHVFLPAHSTLRDVKVKINEEVRIDGAVIEDGSMLLIDDLAKIYELQTESQTVPLRFWQASNVATLYIDTRSGNMDHVHENKDNKEHAAVSLYLSDGTLDHSDNVCTIKGRGNATWSCRKKPYNLTLSQKGDLLGMGASTDWVLLANAMDESNLFNHLAFELSEQVSMPWTPEHAYVELYLNGSYNGLYLLTEKVQTDDTRLALDTDAGDFLARVEPNMRRRVLDNPILTRYDRVIDLCSPELTTGAQRRNIEKLADSFEQSVMMAGQTAFPGQIDMESFAKRYLIDEICANIDADLASSYFFYRDGTFYAGPIWDFDMAFGNQIYNENPTAFIAKNLYRSRTFMTPYDTALLENEQFSSLVKQLYQTQFLPIVEQWVESYILQEAQKIQSATQMNSVRWSEMFEKNPVTTTTAEGTVEYLIRRTDFLSSAWLQDVDYCTLQFEVTAGSSYWNICIPKEQTLEKNFLQMGEDFRYLQLDDLDESADWIILQTGEAFDITQPVTEDLILVQRSVQEQKEEAEYGQ